MNCKRNNDKFSYFQAILKNVDLELSTWITKTTNIYATKSEHTEKYS